MRAHVHVPPQLHTKGIRHATMPHTDIAYMDSLLRATRHDPYRRMPSANLAEPNLITAAITLSRYKKRCVYCCAAQVPAAKHCCLDTFAIAV